MDVEDAFTDWLDKKLGTFDIEDEVMGSYIRSIITTDDADGEKADFLKDVLGDLVPGVDIDALCSEIMNKWNECHKKTVSESEKKEQFDIGSKVALIMEKQVQPVLKQANRSTEEELLREAILTRCTFVSSEEEDYESDEGGATSSFQPSSQQNQNAEAVVQAEKERREVMKSENDKKKAADKVNREKQKQKQEERKEKERKRTQKQERRR